MLKILAGLQSPTRGVVATPKDVTIGYLPQVIDVYKRQLPAPCSKRIHSRSDGYISR